MKSEEYGVYDIDFKKEVVNEQLTGNIIAIGYHGGRGRSQPIVIGRGTTKKEAFANAKAYINREREETNARHKEYPPYYQYRRNFNFGSL